MVKTFHVFIFMCHTINEKLLLVNFPKTTVGAAMLDSTAKEIHNCVCTYIPICVPH